MLNIFFTTYILLKNRLHQKKGEALKKNPILL